jgi:hypothetical protein
MKTATMQDAIKAGACYSEEQLKKLFGRRKSFSVKQIAALKIQAKDKVWALTRDHFLDTQDKAVRFAVFCAEQSLKYYEAKYQDDRPRKAIEAAKSWLENPTQENKNAAAYAAANAAAYAANAEH